MENIIDKNIINQKRKERAKVLTIIGFALPAIWILMMVLFYEGIGLWIPNQTSVIFAMVFYYISMTLFYNSIAMLYKEHYDTFVTYLSLSILFWFACFIVFPFRYQVDTIQIYENSIAKGLMISTLFSSSGQFMFLFLYMFRLMYEKEKSILSLVLTSILLFLLVVVAIVYFILYNTRIYIDNLIIIPILTLFVLIHIALVTITLVSPLNRHLDVARYVLYGLMIALTVAMAGIGLFWGDYISWRSFFIGGLFSLFAILSYVPMIYAFLETTRWNTKLYPEEENPNSLAYWLKKSETNL